MDRVELWKQITTDTELDRYSGRILLVNSAEFPALAKFIDTTFRSRTILYYSIQRSVGFIKEQCKDRSLFRHTIFVDCVSFYLDKDDPEINFFYEEPPQDVPSLIRMLSKYSDVDSDVIVFDSITQFTEFVDPASTARMLETILEFIQDDILLSGKLFIFIASSQHGSTKRIPRTFFDSVLRLDTIPDTESWTD